MATAITEKDLVALENKYWQAMKDGDVATALRLTDIPCIVSGPRGIGRIDRQGFESMFKAGPTLRSFQLKDGAMMRKLGDDVAVLAYELHGEWTVEGRPVTVDAAESSTWVLRDGSWACAQHSEAIEGDPFGRDRTPAREAAEGAYE